MAIGTDDRGGLPGAGSEDGRGERVVALLETGNRWWGFLLVAAGLTAAWLVAWRSGQATAVSRHLFYVPVVVAAVRLGIGWTLAAAVGAGLLAGPLVPLAGRGFDWSDPSRWVVRLTFFLMVGLIVAVLVESVQRYQRHKLELAEARQALAEQERALAVQRAAVIQTVSHELRTPLTVIQGTVALWSQLADEITPPAAAKLIAPMAHAAARLDSLTTMVLAAADAEGDERLDPVDVAIDRLLTEAVARVSRHVDRGRVEVVVEGDLATVATVPDFVETALGALIDNALKLSPPSEPVTVTARSAGPEQLVIVVRDHGAGMSPQLASQVFEPFTQGDQSTTRPHEGLGIGLYTARKLIKRLGGDIDLRPHPEGGTLARISLPAELSTDDPAPSDHEGAEAQGADTPAGDRDRR